MEGVSDSLIDTLSMVHFLPAPISIGKKGIVPGAVVRIVLWGVFDEIVTQETAWALLLSRDGDLYYAGYGESPFRSTGYQNTDGWASCWDQYCA